MRWGSRSGVRRSIAIIGIVAVVGLTPTAAMAGTSAVGAVARTADAGSGTAEISGRLVGPGAASDIGGVTVTLTAAPASGTAITRTIATRPDGSFTFRDLAGGDWTYTITAPYQGATFSSDPVTVPAGQALTVKLPVFVSTDSPAKLKIASWIVWLDVTGDKVAVEQDLSYTNAGTTAYVGTTPVTGASPGAKAAVLLPIAPGAGGFQYLGRFEVCCSAVESASWAHTRPINPGGSSGTLRYEATKPESLAFVAQFPTDSVTFLVPDGTTVSSPQLTRSGTTTDKNTSYNVYKSGAVKAGDAVTLSFSAPASSDGSGSPWWLIALVIGVLAALVVGEILVIRRRRGAAAPTKAPPGATAKPAPAAKPAKQAKSAKQPKSSTTPVAAATATAAAATSTATVERSRAEVLAEELAQLDVKFENGELTDEAAYRRVRESLVQRLVETVESDPKSLA
jgi:hypothetical protein